jgi:hypothetical protein
MVLGAMFAGWGLYEHFSFITALGAAFAFFGVVTLIRVLRITAASDQKI